MTIPSRGGFAASVLAGSCARTVPLKPCSAMMAASNSAVVPAAGTFFFFFARVFPFTNRTVFSQFNTARATHRNRTSNVPSTT